MTPSKAPLDLVRPVAAPLQPVAKHYRVVVAGLWLVLLAAAILFIYPLWPAAVYQWQRLHPGPPLTITIDSRVVPSGGSGLPSRNQATTVADDQTPIAGNRVIIPAIGVNTPIVEGSSLKILNQVEGIWHQTGDPTKGNFVLAGHRFKYLPPNTSTLYNLDKLKPGDVMAVDWLGKRTVYRVAQMETVPAGDVALLDPTPKPQLTLYSCSDIQQTHRVVAIGTPLPKP